MQPIIAGQGHLPALGEHERTEVGNVLQAQLVELVDLSLLGKQLHWSVVGPHFRSLHLQLDELIDSWRELGDTVAERAIAIGSAVDGQARTVAADSPIAGVEPGAIEDDVLVRELSERLAQTAERTRERAERVSELDPATEDVLIEVIRALEEQLWMVRAQMPART
jgi:starvation-inducible DNA-binding protein